MTGFLIGLAGIAFAVLIVVGLMTFNTVILWFLWNVVVVSIFHGPHITFWQAMAVGLVLALLTPRK
jgi:hypothetical protein